jgi:hypothetical protein
MTVERDALKTEIDAVGEADDGLEVRLVFRNDADRALHYIAGVRGLLYDPATKRLTVRLSDEGREIIPGGANIRPPFRHVEPGSQSELTLKLPTEITMLAEPTDPERKEVMFQAHRIADAEQIVVEVAWADVPFYEDPRPKDVEVMPSVVWQQHTQTASIVRDRPAD